MKVILIENVENLGGIGDAVNVSAGYARNFLIPKKLAIQATDRSLGVLEHKQRLVDQKIRKEKGEAEDLAKQMEELSLTVAAQAGEENKLFGSVTSMTIQNALKAEGYVVDKKKILLEEPIKELGIYTVTIKLHQDVTANLKVWVVKE